MINCVTKLRQLRIRGAKEINKRTHGWLAIFSSAIGEILKPGSAITAAAIAYFALFSLFPITLLSISVASFMLGPSMDQQLIIQKIEFVAPALGQLIGQNIDKIMQTRGPVSGIAFIGLIWSASTFFYTLTHSLNAIWDIKKRRAAWKRRGLAILFILAIVGPILFMASFASSLLSYLRTWWPGQIGLIGGSISFLVAILLDIALFMVLYMILPHGPSSWREILPGAMAAGFLWELAKKVFLFFVSIYISTSNMVYGSVAAIIAFLAWAYLSGLIFLLGAYISLSNFQANNKQKNQQAI